MAQQSALIAKTALVVALSGMLIVSGCGRKGALDRPGATPAPTSDETAAVPEPESAEAETPKEDRPFILDAIL